MIVIRLARRIQSMAECEIFGCSFRTVLAELVRCHRQIHWFAKTNTKLCCHRFSIFTLNCSDSYWIRNNKPRSTINVVMSVCGVMSCEYRFSAPKNNRANRFLEHISSWPNNIYLQYCRNAMRTRLKRYLRVRMKCQSNLTEWFVSIPQMKIWNFSVIYCSIQNMNAHQITCRWI